jgi:hypothetical protein
MLTLELGGFCRRNDFTVGRSPRSFVPRQQCRAFHGHWQLDDRSEDQPADDGDERRRARVKLIGCVPFICHHVFHWIPACAYCCPGKNLLGLLDA